MGLLKITEGNVTDYDYITNDIMKYSNLVSIQKVGYDKYNATQWAISATDLGLPLEEYLQPLGKYNNPTGYQYDIGIRDVLRYTPLR